MVIALLALAACDEGEETSIRGTYIGGSEGIKMEFAPDAPPEMTADNKQQNFDIVVQLTNKGEADVEAEDAQVTIKGFLPEAFGKSKGDLEINPDETVEGRIRTPDGTIIEPPYIEAIVEDLEYQNKEPGNIQLPIRAEICYLYETNIATKLCIKEDMLKQEDDDICEISSTRSVSSSGAPVQVSKVSQTGAGRDKTRFTFTIANVDTGKVYRENSDCSPSTTDENKVYVEILELEGSEVKCTGLQGGTEDTGYITLSGGTPRDVTCTATFSESQRTDRLQPFQIRLSYNYNEFIEQPIEIVYTPEDGEWKQRAANRTQNSVNSR